jgi:hypothetical protein
LDYLVLLAAQCLSGFTHFVIPSPAFASESMTSNDSVTSR